MKGSRFCDAIGALALSLAMGSAYAQAETAAAAALFARDQAKNRICNIDDIPRNPNGSLAPSSQDHRVRLYLRCELGKKGGANVCCDHLSSADANRFRVCPDNPVNLIVPLRDGFKAALGPCP
jgi:hypothetical protein